MALFLVKVLQCRVVYLYLKIIEIHVADTDTDMDTDADADTEAYKLTGVSTNGTSHVHVESSSLPGPHFFSQSMVVPELSELHTGNTQTIKDEQDLCVLATKSHSVFGQMEKSSQLSNFSQDSMGGTNRSSEETSDSTIMMTI